jgi:replicative DNA helicase
VSSIDFDPWGKAQSTAEPTEPSDDLRTCTECKRSWYAAWLGEQCDLCGKQGQRWSEAFPTPDPDPAAETSLRYTSGGSFILDTPADPIPLWGRGQAVLWAEGEALTIVGGQGVGKTTLAQQVALGRCGFEEYAEVLGFPIAANTWGVTCYMAMDRPRQAARSFRRMVGETWREDLDRRLHVWEGPPVVDVAKHPTTLVEYAENVNAETLIVDSLKDAALGLSDDEVGGGWNRARQLALRSGVQIIELHHNRKALSGAKAAHPAIDDVYGSTWITSGAGSVLLLAGAPGDPIVTAHHLKQPAEEVGPLKILHDHDAGRSSVWQQVDVLALASAKPGGISAAEAAQAMFEVEKETPAQRQKARRKLERLANEGLVNVLDAGSEASSRATRWGIR